MPDDHSPDEGPSEEDYSQDQQDTKQETTDEVESYEPSGGPTPANKHNASPGGQQPNGGQPHQTPPSPPQGHRSAQTYQGPTIGDIFNRVDTMGQIKFGILVFATVSLGLGIAGLGLSATSSSAQIATTMGGAMTILGAFFLSPLIGAITSYWATTNLSGIPNNLVYGTAATIGFAGTVVSWLIAFLTFSMMSNSASGAGGGANFGDLFIGVFFEAIGVAIVGYIIAWGTIRFASPS